MYWFCDMFRTLSFRFQALTFWARAVLPPALMVFFIVGAVAITTLASPDHCIPHHNYSGFPFNFEQFNSNFIKRNQRRHFQSFQNISVLLLTNIKCLDMFISYDFAKTYNAYCVTRAPLLYFIRSWVALSFKVVCQSVSQASVTPVQISTLCNI